MEAFRNIANQPGINGRARVALNEERQPEVAEGGIRARAFNHMTRGGKRQVENRTTIGSFQRALHEGYPKVVVKNIFKRNLESSLLNGGSLTVNMIKESIESADSKKEALEKFGLADAKEELQSRVLESLDSNPERAALYNTDTFRRISDESKEHLLNILDNVDGSLEVFQKLFDFDEKDIMAVYRHPKLRDSVFKAISEDVERSRNTLGRFPSENELSLLVGLNISDFDKRVIDAGDNAADQDVQGMLSYRPDQFDNLMAYMESDEFNYLSPMDKTSKLDEIEMAWMEGKEYDLSVHARKAKHEAEEKGPE